MNTLAGVQLAAGPREARTFEYEAPDAESMLVAFLSELVYTQEQESLGFDNFRIGVEGSSLKVEMEGAPMVSMAKAIKAVTFHNLKIVETQRGREAEIVFDV